MKFYNCYTINTGWTAGVSIVLMTIKTRGRNIDVAFCEGFRMPARDGRRRELCGLWPAFANLQRRKSREGIRKAVPRGLWRFGFCGWDCRREPMGLSSTVDANDTRERGVSVILG